MRLRWIFGLIASCGLSTGQETPAVDAAIPAAVKALAAPAVLPFENGLKLAVTTSEESAQIHVNQGLNHLHGGWDFEASRHFAAAMREDPECILAHWGMVMCLLSPSPETTEARKAATERLLDLVDQKKGTELERGYAYGLIKYIEAGPAGAANAFRKVADNFPNDLQAGIFAALFGRSGYDEFGNPMPDQEGAEKRLLDLIGRFPESPLPLNALLIIRAEAPDLKSSLPLARKLCQLAPDYAPYFHLLGHYEWRCGEHGKAAAAFGKASSSLDLWMKENKVSVADCPEWVKAECYRIVALASKGRFDEAIAASLQMAATPFPKDRLISPGVRQLLWDGRTLTARILIHRDGKGDAEAALASLPIPEQLKQYRDHTLAYWWIDGLRFALEARRLIDGGKPEEASQAIAALTRHGEEMAKMQAVANTGGERSSWTRGFRALEILASELRGRLALAGPKEGYGSAYNWFRSAADRQRPTPLLYPPMLLTPMAIRLSDYYIAVGKPDEALLAFKEAIGSYPIDMKILEGLKRAYLAAKQAEKAEVVADSIRILEEK